MLAFVTFALFLVTQSNACLQRAFPSGLVCVCSANGCDTIPQIEELTENEINVFYTSPADPGITRKDAAFGGDLDPTATLITIDSQQTYQTILGFGGVFTDVATINIHMLSSDLQDQLLSSYFSEYGIEYNLCRVPVGAIDFSVRMYTLDDNDGDVNLEQFALADEDLNHKIPIIERAKEYRGSKPLNLLASAWTAPLWMKDRQVWSSGSMLKPEYYQTWANYHVKYFDEYLKHNVSFWGLTVGNEPLTGFMRWTAIPSMGWSTTAQAKYIKENIGPTLRNSQHNLKLLIHDEGLNVLPFNVPPVSETLQDIIFKCMFDMDALRVS